LKVLSQEFKNKIIKKRRSGCRNRNRDGKANRKGKRV